MLRPYGRCTTCTQEPSSFFAPLPEFGEGLGVGFLPLQRQRHVQPQPRPPDPKQ
jgi:hypothetical protein